MVGSGAALLEQDDPLGQELHHALEESHDEPERLEEEDVACAVVHLDFVVWHLTADSRSHQDMSYQVIPYHVRQIVYRRVHESAAVSMSHIHKQGKYSYKL